MASSQQPIAQGIKTPFRNRRFMTFVVCLLLSAVFWVLHALSKEYELNLRVPVTYTHLPDRGLVAVDLPDSIDARVSGSGFILLAYQWTQSTTPVELDVRQAKALGNGDYALSTWIHPERLEGTIGRGLHVERLLTDTLILNFAGRVEKKVPVRPKVTVKCAPGYRLGDSITTSPSMVTVSGAEALLKRVSFVETEQKNYTKLDHSLNEPVKLVLPQGVSQVEIDPATARLVVAVGQYTESRLSIPVEVINVPANLVLKTIPDKVDVTFQVPVENFNAIHGDMFRIIADYSKADQQTGDIPLEIVRQPLNIRNLKLAQPRVQYIIRK